MRLSARHVSCSKDNTDALLATLAPVGDSKIETLSAQYMYEALAAELRRRDKEKVALPAPSGTEAAPLRRGLRPRLDGVVPHNQSGDSDALRVKMRGLHDQHHDQLQKDSAQF